MGRCSIGGAVPSASILLGVGVLFVMVSCGGSEAASRRRSALARGAKDRVPTIGRARFASSSTGRWHLTFEAGRLVFHERGITLGGRRVQSPLCESGLCLSREGNVGQSRPAAGLTVGAAQISLRAAIRRLCGTRTSRGGMKALAARTGIGVDLKQFETQRATWRQ